MKKKKGNETKKMKNPNLRIKIKREIKT